MNTKTGEIVNLNKTEARNDRHGLTELLPMEAKILDGIDQEERPCALAIIRFANHRRKIGLSTARVYLKAFEDGYKAALKDQGSGK
jgi:hypothetical protein